MAMSDDPLRHADIGETETVTREATFTAFTPDIFEGDDRDGEPEITEVRVRDLDSGYKEIVVEWEGEVTKALPPRWDDCDEPRTDAERKQERRKTWARQFGVAIPTIAVMGFSVYTTHRIMRLVSGEVSVNGERLTYSFLDMMPLMAFVLIVGSIITYLMGDTLRVRTGGHR